jgi:hypothetical protein
LLQDNLLKKVYIRFKVRSYTSIVFAFF